MTADEAGALNVRFTATQAQRLRELGADPLVLDRVFTDVLNRDPTNRTALFNRARARHKLGRFREAATDARKLVTLEPRFAKAWFVYGAALLMFHHDVDALAALEKSIDLDPLDPEAHHTYAGALHMLNRDEEAIREWSLAHQMDPSRAETAVGQAMTLLRQDAGRSQQGWQTFESRRASHCQTPTP